MVSKISNIFKKGHNDWLKVTISTIIAAVMVIFFSKTVASSYALSNLDSLTTGQGHVTEDRVNLFPEFTEDEIIALIPFFATDDNGERYTVYCLEKNKGWSPGETITRNETPLDDGYVYLLQNGYPKKSLTGDNANDEYLTQIAVWWYQDLVNGVSDDETGVLTANQKSVIKSSKYYRYIEPLITGAVNAKNNPIEINPTFSINTNDFKLSSDNKYLMTDSITITSNVDYDNYLISVDNNAVEVLDNNNNVISNNTINKGESFKLRVDLSKIDNPITVNISAIVNYTEFEAYSYDPPKEDMQQSVASVLVPVSKQKVVSNSVSMPTGSLTIRKVDTENKPLEGANIEVIRKATNKTVANFETTTEDYLIDNLLPGEYEIKELSAPNGYYIDEESSVVVITDSNLNVSKTITNSKYNVKIRKVDSDTGNPLSGAVLNIVNSDNRVVDTITTTDDYVSIDTSKLSEGTYKVVEVSAPDGYFINSKEKEFTIDKNNTSVTVDFKDEKNEVLIEKKDLDNKFVSGARLRLVRVSDNQIIDEWTSNDSAHSIKGLVKGEYKVIEVEAPNGYTLSNSEVPLTITGEEKETKRVTFYNSKNQVVINKVDENGKPLSGAKLKITNSNGDEIKTFITTKEAYTIDKLSPGTYYVEEIEAPSGYQLNKEKESFTIDENTTSIQVTMENIKTRMYLAKVDENGEFIPGATLRLLDSNKEEIETFVSGDMPHFIEGLDYGIYYLEEVTAPDGYIKNNEQVKIEFTDYNKVRGGVYLNIYTILNKTGSLTIEKIDSETKDVISGVTLEIRKGDKVVKTITTTNSPTVITDLGEGTYNIVEVNTPLGYIKSDKEYVVTIDSKTPNATVTIENKPIIVNLGKIDASTKKYIAGATMKLERLDGVMEPITFVSGNSPYQVRNLVPGLYSLEELEAPSGYVFTGSKVTFRVLETGKVQTVNISNDITTISVNNKILTVDTNGIEGYKYRLETRDGKVIDEFTTTTKDTYISDSLEIGEYTLKQIEAPEGVIVNERPIYFSVSDINEVNVVNFVNDFTKVSISKKDMVGSEEVEGAHLVIKDSNGSVVEEWISSNTPHYIEKLSVGKYTLTETIAPDGYILNTSVVEFNVLETGDIQSEVMFNSKPVEVPNTGSNATYIYLIGGILIIIGASIIYISYRNKTKNLSR